MGNRYDEDGEILKFVGREKTHVRGKLLTDGMGREWISAGGDGGKLSAFLPDNVDMESVNDDEDNADEYRFTFAIHVEKATGEFRDDN